MLWHHLWVRGTSIMEDSKYVLNFSLSWGQCYETFIRNLRIFVISWSVCWTRLKSLPRTKTLAVTKICKLQNVKSFITLAPWKVTKLWSFFLNFYYTKNDAMTLYQVAILSTTFSSSTILSTCFSCPFINSEWNHLFLLLGWVHSPGSRMSFHHFWWSPWPPRRPCLWRRWQGSQNAIQRSYLRA